VTLDDDAVSRTFFRPRAEYHAYAPRGIATCTQCQGAAVCGYLHERRTGDTLLLFFHGNGEIAADYDSLAGVYTSCGASLWVVDYRGYGRSTGTPSFSDMLHDAEAVLADLPRVSEQVGRRFKHVVVMGRSLGSASAIHLAWARPRALAALVLDSPYADGLALIRTLGGPRLDHAALPGFQDNLDKMRSCTLPCLFIHGTIDRIIPLAEAEALYAACQSRIKEILTIPGAGHNDLLSAGREDYCRSLKHFMARVTAQAGGE